VAVAVCGVALVATFATEAVGDQPAAGVTDGGRAACATPGVVSIGTICTFELACREPQATSSAQAQTRAASHSDRRRIAPSHPRRRAANRRKRITRPAERRSA
jgi:hypothetical protein